MRRKAFLVDYTLYPFGVLVSTDSRKRILHKLKKLGYKVSKYERDLLRMEGDGRTIKLSSGLTVIRLNRRPNSPKRIGYLTHEVFHAVRYLFDLIGIGLCSKSNEAWAYAVQYLTEQILLGFKNGKRDHSNRKP